MQDRMIGGSAGIGTEGYAAKEGREVTLFSFRRAEMQSCASR